MDFNDTAEEAAFRAEARAWLEKNAEPRSSGERPVVRPADDAGVVRDAKAWQAKKADAGWACITWPKAFGGRGATPMQAVIWSQEEARFRTGPNIFQIGHGMCGPTLMVHGSTAHKERYLKPLLRGEEIWCQLFSEPNAGSDLAGLEMRAERDGEHWILNGQKVWTSGAHYADFGILVARHDFTKPKHAGMVFFIVDMKAPGVEIRPIKQISGGSEFNEVFFTDVRVPDTDRLGEVDGGWTVALTTLMNERMSIGMGGAGEGLGVGFEGLFALAEKVGALGDPAVRQRLANIYVRSTGLKYTGQRALTALSRGALPGPEASTGKLVLAAMLQEMAELACELQGPAGAVLNGPALEGGLWQTMVLAAPGMRIAGGSDEVLRNIVGERVLGLPPDMRADKDIPFKDIPTSR
jgi:acyl-CoA dehydrogenase